LVSVCRCFGGNDFVIGFIMGLFFFILRFYPFFPSVGVLGGGGGGLYFMM